MNQNALIKWASGIIGKKFKWGETDCATITRQGLEIFVGTRCSVSLPQWATRREAWRTYKKHGGTSGYLLWHGWRPIDENYVQTGDILVLKTRPMETTCLVINDSVLVIDKKNGICSQKISKIKEACICFRNPKSEIKKCLQQ